MTKKTRLYRKLNRARASYRRMSMTESVYTYEFFFAKVKLMSLAKEYFGKYPLERKKIIDNLYNRFKQRCRSYH